MKSNYYLLTMHTKEDFTDERIHSFISERTNFSIEEYRTFINSFRIQNEKIEKIINFLITYDKGSLCPNKCDAYEPVRDSFSPDRVEDPIKWVSQPGSALYFKRIKSNLKYTGVIENQRFAPIWEDRKATKLLKAIAKEPIYLGEMRFWFDIKDFRKNKKNIGYIENLVTEFDKIAKIAEYQIVEKY